MLHSGKHLLSTVDFVELCITGDCLLTLLVQKKKICIEMCSVQLGTNI